MCVCVCVCVRACVCVCVCVLVLEKCSSCSGNTGTKKKQCYFGSVDPRLTDGSELYMLWMSGWLMVNMLMDALLLSLHCLTYGLSREGFTKKWLSFPFLSFNDHTHTHAQGAETCLRLLPLTWMCVAASWRLWWQGDIQHLVTWLHWGSEWGRGPVPLKAELFCLGSPTVTAAEEGGSLIFVPPHHLCSFGCWCQRWRGGWEDGRERFLNPGRAVILRF